MMKKNNFQQSASSNTSKKAYKKPKLTKHGKVQHLTLGGTSAFFDEDVSQPLI